MLITTHVRKKASSKIYVETRPISEINTGVAVMVRQRGAMSISGRADRLILRPLQYVRQLGDVGGDLASLILAHEICRSASTGLALEIDKRAPGRGGRGL